MFRTAFALTSAALMLTATTAAAQETEPPPGPMPPINACGEMLMVKEVKNTLKTRSNEDQTRIVTTGIRLLRLSDEDSSVVVPERAGRFSVELSETGVTVTSTGATLLIPDDPALVEAIEEAGLPEFPLVVGRLVIKDRGNGPEIVRLKGRVIDVCRLLDR